jgi:hypothetical protein
VSIKVNVLGDVKKKELPGSPRMEFRNGRDSCVRRFGGMYADLLAYMETLYYGVGFGDIPGRFGLDEAHIVANRGTDGLAVLELVLTAYNFGSINIANDILPDPIVEVEWTDLQQDLRRNKLYRAGGTRELTLTLNENNTNDLIDIEFWKNEPSAVLRAAYKYATLDASGGAVIRTLSENAAFFAAKLATGEDSFNDSYPIVRATVYSRNRPAVGKTWVRQNPPAAYIAFDNLSHYEWIFIVSSRHWQRRYWRKDEAWAGALSWDHDHYEAA